jgi:3',5'-cyclic AMP phosphodiesterase CpdA
MARILAVLAAAAAAAAAAAQSAPLRIWHLTDTHIDPYYVEGALAGDDCFCELHDACPRMPATCVAQAPGAPGSALPFGTPEDNCATPVALWEAALQFMVLEAPDAPIIFHTGDFGEAGLTAPCSPSSPAEDQIVSIITRAMAGLRAAFPAARV